MSQLNGVDDSVSANLSPEELSRFLDWCKFMRGFPDIGFAVATSVENDGLHAMGWWLHEEWQWWLSGEAEQ